MAGNERRWVWYAAQEKDSGKPSVLAIVEVIASVAAYWWIAAVWQTHVHLLVALVAAPLVLLRSEASVAAAQGMWDGYLNNNDEIPFGSLEGGTLLLAGAATGFIVSWWISTVWLESHEGFSIFWRATVIAWISWNMMLAGSIAVAGTRAITIAIGLAGVTTMAAAATAAAAAAAAVITTAGIAAGVGVIAGAAAIAIVEAITGVATSAIMLLFPGFFFGAWLRSITTRAISVLRYLPAGLRALPDNWRRLMLNEDASRAPELLPGVTQTSDAFKFENTISRIFTDTFENKVIGTLGAVPVHRRLMVVAVRQIMALKL